VQVLAVTIDLSTSPPKCDLCILGKQTRSTVPSVRENQKATRPLERVYVDLCGPMPVSSRSNRLYSMNVIDDFSSYVWSLPLRSKDEAAPILQSWHRAVENQCGERLKILVTDNGELSSHAMTAWCSLHGIDHQFTAPYTSAQNGRAECLHRTLLNKARAMRLACNAPPNLWDEFCSTAAYFTNFTASSTIAGKTPFELWHKRPPSLSHLREIGCRAYALTPTNNPKIFQRSVPCVLIRYAPHAKAYRLWNPSSGRILNSYHVSFLEHLDTLPIPLLPGKTVDHNPSASPSWDTPASTSEPSAPPASPPPDPPSCNKPPLSASYRFYRY
jgi:transposase InsO family protein